jgi:hypothetical protein
MLSLDVQVLLAEGRNVAFFSHTACTVVS